jgi:hypothetical protein
MSAQIQKISNPQGKGIVGVVDDLRAVTPVNVQSKNSHQWLADYFTSTLVLGAQYGFKPVIGKSYYLYLKDREWRLSLIEPQAWQSQESGLFFSECVLNKDMSWGLVLSTDWQKHESLVSTVKKLEHEFMQCMNDDNPIVEKLPFYLRHLSYYQRLGANALARSLKQSLEIKMGKEECMLLAGNSLLKDIVSSKISLLEKS